MQSQHNRYNIDFVDFFLVQLQTSNMFLFAEKKSVFGRIPTLRYRFFVQIKDTKTTLTDIFVMPL